MERIGVMKTGTEKAGMERKTAAGARRAPLSCGECARFEPAAPAPAPARAASPLRSSGPRRPARLASRLPLGEEAGSVSYKDRFRRIRPAAVEATRRLIAAKPWRGNPGRDGPQETASALAACEAWLEEVSRAYGILKPALFVGSPEAFLSGYGCYDPEANAIHLPKFSVVTLAHEFRHAWQHQTGRRVGDEEDARGWSVSLVYLASPKFYWQAKAKGLLVYW